MENAAYLPPGDSSLAARVTLNPRHSAGRAAGPGRSNRRGPMKAAGSARDASLSRRRLAPRTGVPSPAGPWAAPQPPLPKVACPSGRPRSPRQTALEADAPRNLAASEPTLPAI
jgi:hypothetical protein